MKNILSGPDSSESKNNLRSKKVRGIRSALAAVAIGALSILPAKAQHNNENHPQHRIAIDSVELKNLDSTLFDFSKICHEKLNRSNSEIKFTPDNSNVRRIINYINTDDRVEISMDEQSSINPNMPMERKYFFTLKTSEGRFRFGVKETGNGEVHTVLLESYPIGDVVGTENLCPPINFAKIATDGDFCFREANYHPALDEMKEVIQRVKKVVSSIH